jgi:hypothetical protein
VKRAFVAAAIACAAAAAPAHAAMIEVTRTLDLRTAHDDAALRAAITSAVADLVEDGLAFTPTVVVVTRAVVIGTRVHVRLLLADDEERHLSEPADTRPGSPGHEPI